MFVGHRNIVVILTACALSACSLITPIAELRACLDGGCGGAEGEGGTSSTPCAEGLADCDGDGQCETDLNADDASCGVCGNVCEALAGEASSCSAGTCIRSCVDGSADCDGDPANGCEVLLEDDPDHCGVCGNACFDSPCRAGRCTIQTVTSQIGAELGTMVAKGDRVLWSRYPAGLWELDLAESMVQSIVLPLAPTSHSPLVFDASGFAWVSETPTFAVNLADPETFVMSASFEVPQEPHLIATGPHHMVWAVAFPGGLSQLYVASRNNEAVPRASSFLAGEVTALTVTSGHAFAVFADADEGLHRISLSNPDVSQVVSANGAIGLVSDAGSVYVSYASRIARLSPGGDWASSALMFTKGRARGPMAITQHNGVPRLVWAMDMEEDTGDTIFAADLSDLGNSDVIATGEHQVSSLAATDRGIFWVRHLEGHAAEVRLAPH